MAKKNEKDPGAKKLNQRVSRFRSAEDDARAARRQPRTPQTRSHTHRLAFLDHDFLKADAQRGVRLQLELEKVEQVLKAHEIASTVILFGGARIPAPDEEPRADTRIAAQSLKDLSHFYTETEKFARIVSQYSLGTGGHDYVIATGGGPGIMEAGNKGASSIGAKSVGFGMTLPNEEEPNQHISPDLSFNFHYFSIRKMHFLMRARAIAVFPGGFGTLDETFEALTLIQMKRMDPVPFIFFGENYWRTIINFEALRDAGTIAAADLDLFEFAETADQAWKIICDFHQISD